MEVIPSLNCQFKDLSCARERIRTIEALAGWVHLDIEDGRFTFRKTWGSPEEWQSLGSKLKLEVHLMIEEPEKHARAWLEAGAKRLIIQAETLDSETAEVITALARQYGAETMLAFSPETNPESASAYADIFSEFQVLSVHPGLSAQNFLPLVLDKVKFLRSKYPQSRIEIDGGINLETGKLAKKAGADILISASYIFGSADPKAAYSDLLSC